MSKYPACRLYLLMVMLSEVVLCNLPEPHTNELEPTELSNNSLDDRVGYKKIFTHSQKKVFQ